MAPAGPLSPASRAVRVDSTDVQYARLRKAYLLDERGAETDPAKFGPLNNKWHDALRLSAHNATISDLLARLDSRLLLLRPRTFTPQPDDRSAEEHAAILDAISGGDQDAAGAAMAGHLRRMRDWRIRSLIKDGM